MRYMAMLIRLLLRMLLTELSTRFTRLEHRDDSFGSQHHSSQHHNTIVKLGAWQCHLVMHVLASCYQSCMLLPWVWATLEQ